MYRSNNLALILTFFSLSACQRTPLASRCATLPTASDVACVNNYAAVLPLQFNRTIATTDAQLPTDSFRLTSVPDSSFELVRNATFIVFDEERGSQILGSAPTYEFVFESRNDSIHEAPVYVPYLKSIIYSLPHQGIYEQQLVNLSTSTPTLRNYTTSPPVYAVNGGKLFNGSIYWAAEGGVPFPDPSNTSQTILQAPGIYKLNPNTSEVTTLVNNYFGTPLNSPNDLFIDKDNGDIFFTDSWYGYAINVSANYPALRPATYRFRPSTGHLSIVEDSIAQSNGIGFSPDGKTAYITDTGITDFSDPPTDGSLPKYGWDRLVGRAVYAFDLVDGPVGKYLTNKRPIYLAEEFAEDGFHVSSEGYLVGAAGNGVDILSQYGELLVRITTANISVNNIQFAPRADGRLSDLWIFGMGGIARASLNITGMGDE